MELELKSGQERGEAKDRGFNNSAEALPDLELTRRTLLAGT